MEILVLCMRARHSLMSLKKSDGVSLISLRSSSTISMLSWAAAEGRCQIDDIDAVGCVVAHARPLITQYFWLRHRGWERFCWRTASSQ